MKLTRAQFLKGSSKTIGTHPVPELGGEVGLAEFTADEAETISKLQEDGVPATVRIVIMGACDDQGKRLFTDEDIPALRGELSKVIGPLANAILSHNALTGASQEELKNASSETGTGDSASVSPSSLDALSLN